MKKKKTEIRILGVMTGTSCDALDAACVGINVDGWRLIWSKSTPYPKKLRELVLAIQKPETKHSLRELLDLHRDLGEWYGRSLEKITRTGKRADRPEAIANHGQTIAHFPASGKNGTTLQLGDPTRIAKHTGLTVISNFREGDQATQGQGAPLVPLFHRILAERLSEGRNGISIHNIGGISNLTYINPAGQMLAFDTGPGNIWIDAATELVTKGKQKMDRGGKLALSGDVDWRAVDAILKHPFFKKNPPKSTGRDDFPFSFVLSKIKARGVSLISTTTAITIESIARAYEQSILFKRLPLSEIYLCGGGAKNTALRESLQLRLPQVEILTLEEAGFDSKYTEAQAFAVFGFLALLGVPTGGPWTGAKGFGPPAHIIPGENWTHVIAKISRLLAL